jgi:hypothetical protein
LCEEAVNLPPSAYLSKEQLPDKTMCLGTSRKRLC